ncbi:hypothetical protein IG631_22732 [Alternaria alternata]|nr:hypothetical protein IG631_22732 [Alternaria alternata]
MGITIARHVVRRWGFPGKVEIHYQQAASLHVLPVLLDRGLDAADCAIVELWEKSRQPVDVCRSLVEIVASNQVSNGRCSGLLGCAGVLGGFEKAALGVRLQLPSLSPDFCRHVSRE